MVRATLRLPIYTRLRTVNANSRLLQKFFFLQKHCRYDQNKKSIFSFPTILKDWLFDFVFLIQISCQGQFWNFIFFFQGHIVIDNVNVIFVLKFEKKKKFLKLTKKWKFKVGNEEEKGGRGGGSEIVKGSMVVPRVFLLQVELRIDGPRGSDFFVGWQVRAILALLTHPIGHLVGQAGEHDLGTRRRGHARKSLLRAVAQKSSRKARQFDPMNFKPWSLRAQNHRLRTSCGSARISTRADRSSAVNKSARKPKGAPLIDFPPRCYNNFETLFSTRSFFLFFFSHLVKLSVLTFGFLSVLSSFQNSRVLRREIQKMQNNFVGYFGCRVKKRVWNENRLVIRIVIIFYCFLFHFVIFYWWNKIVSNIANTRRWPYHLQPYTTYAKLKYNLFVSFFSISNL